MTTTMTLAEYEQANGLPPGILRRYQRRRSFPPSAGTRPSRRGKPANTYRPADLAEFVRGLPLPGTTPTGAVTIAEYAAELGVAVSTINQTWRKRYPEHWPKPVDSRGRAHLYRREDLDRLAQRAR